MQIRKVVETPDGKLEFEGVVEGKELELIIESGLRWLIALGALPFHSFEEGEEMDFAPGSDELQ